MKSFLVYKFTCARSSSSYTGETFHHFKTRIEEHIKWITRFSTHPFTIASVPLSLFFFFFFFFAFLVHLLFSLAMALIIGIFYCLYYTSLLLHFITTHLVSHFSYSPIIFIISTLIIGTFYYLIYTLLLLHLFITQLLKHTFYNNYVINICPRQLL